jgi:hypothetical protein
MSLAAALVLATAATLGVAALLLAVTRRAKPATTRSWIVALAHAIALSGLQRLPAEQLARYREEYQADLLQLNDDPRAALSHALQTAAGTTRLTRMLQEAPPRNGPLRRVLAHVGLPVRLDDAHRHGDASYVFGGALRSRR